MLLNSTTGTVMLKDNSTPLGTDLLSVKSNNEAVTYFAVSSNGINTDGTITSRGDDTYDLMRRYNFFSQS